MNIGRPTTLTFVFCDH